MYFYEQISIPWYYHTGGNVDVGCNVDFVLCNEFLVKWPQKIISIQRSHRLLSLTKMSPHVGRCSISHILLVRSLS
jgi:hypothetical protein